MQFSKERITEFRSLLEKDYPDHVFTDEEVLDSMQRMVRLVELVCKPIPPIHYVGKWLLQNLPFDKLGPRAPSLEEFHKMFLVYATYGVFYVHFYNVSTEMYYRLLGGW